MRKTRLAGTLSRSNRRSAVTGCLWNQTHPEPEDYLAYLDYLVAWAPGQPRHIVPARGGNGLYDNMVKFSL